MVISETISIDQSAYVLMLPLMPQIQIINLNMNILLTDAHQHILAFLPHMGQFAFHKRRPFISASANFQHDVIMEKL